MRLKKGQTGTLKIVKDAGLKLNKKDKTVNKKAGLDGKGKTAQGVTKVKRRKPLEVKHVRRMRKAGLAFACVGIAGVTAVGLGFFTQSPIEELTDMGYATVCFEKPADGSNPCDHSLVENVGYLNYVLQNQPYWSSEMHSTVHTVMEQTVSTYKQYYNGVLISADIAQGVSSTATQFCVADGVVLWRSSASKNFNGMDTEWSTKEPEGYTIPKFKTVRGFPPSEFSVYVLNENTIKNANDYSVVANGNGTYTMTLDLNVGLDDGEKSADYYYKQQMYVTGGLDKQPVINETKVEYIFDGDWRLLEFTITDSYMADMVISVACTSETHTEYFYDEAKAENTYYDDYFKQYINNFAEAEDPDNSAPNALNYLAAAFGSVLDEGATFKLKLDVGELGMDGVVHVGLKNGSIEDIRVKLGDISAFIEGSTLYFTDGGAKYKLDTSAFALPETEESSTAFDINSIMDQLTGGEFTVTDGGAKLDTTLELFGIKVDLHFTFEVKDGVVSLGDVKAKIDLGGTPIDAVLSFGSESDIPAKPQDISGYTDIFNEGIALKTSVTLDDMNLSGIVKIIMSKGKFEGVIVNLDSLGVYYDCPRNMLYLTDGNVRYKISLSGMGSVDVSAILANLNVNSILSEIIKNITTSKDGISTNATLNILEQTIKAAVSIKLNGGISVGADVEVLGHKVSATVGLTNEEVVLPDLTEYVDILNEGITLNVDLAIDGLNLKGLVYVGLKEGKLTEVRADLGEIEVYYIDNTLYITDGNVKYKVSMPATATNFAALDLDALAKEIVNNLTFNKDGVSTEATLNILEQTIKAAVSIKLNGGISVGADVEVLGHKVHATVGLTNEEVVLPDLTEYVDILNEGITFDVSLTLDEKNEYGDGAIKLDGKLFIGLDGGKFTEIRADFGCVAVYYSIADKDLYIKVGETKLKVPLENMESGSAIDMASLLPNDTAAIIRELIVNLVADTKEISTNANFNIFDAIVPVSLKMNLSGGIKAEAQLVLLGINLKAGVAFGREEVPALSDGEKAEYTDVVKNAWQAVENLIGDEISAKVSGSLYSYDNANYAQYGYVKYNFNAMFEYQFDSVTYDENGNEIKRPAINLNFGEKNENGETVGASFWVDSEVYMHFNLELAATSPKDDSLTLDVMILDANPVATQNGVTGGGYTKNGVLDVYLSVSKYTAGDTRYDPLMIYAPMDEIMTLVSMVGAMANLDNISFEDNAALDGAVKQIADVINNLLIENYIPYTKDEFSSLGDSLIPQIMGKSLGEFLEEIMAGLGAGDKKQEEESLFDITEDYIKDISCGNDSLKITLNSPIIYGMEMDEDDYLTVQFIKSGNKLSAVQLNSIYFGKNNVNELDLGLTLSYGGVERPTVDGGLKGYRDFDGIDTLLKALVNSATHRTDGENAYDLNDYYLLNGKLNANINVIGIKVDVTINLDSIAVYIDENNKVSVDAHISYQGKNVVVGAAINGDSEVFLSIKNDMIYVKRIQTSDCSGWSEKQLSTPIVEYRVMPLSAFADDIINQLCFVLNFGSLISDSLGSVGEGGGSGVDFDGRDYGNIFKYVLNSYTYEETKDEVKWNFAVNGKLLSDLAGMTMTDIPVTFTASKNGDGTLTVKGLKVQESTMNLAGSAVTLNFGAEINYCNPNQVMAENVADSTVAVDELREINSLCWNDILGGGTFGDILKNVNWNLLKADTGVNYITYGNSSDLAVAPLKIKYSVDGENTSFDEWNDVCYVLYNKNTKNIYSYYAKPDLNGLMPQIVGATAVWKNGYEEENGTLIVKAIYDKTYKVTVTSPNPVNGDFVFDNENYVNTLEEAYDTVLLPVNVYYDADGNRYGLKYYVDENGDECSFDKYAFNSYGQLCYVAKVDGDKCYSAVWERVYAVKFVTEFGGESSEKTVWYYENEVLDKNNIPEVPNIQGYTGVWNIPENTAIKPDTEYTFKAKYTINEYSVTVQSAVEATDSRLTLTDGTYKYSQNYVFNATVTLENLVAASPAYKFIGFYDNPEFTGSPVTQFVVRNEAVYYAKWEGKTLNVIYKSDLPFGNAKLGADNYYSFPVTMRYGADDNLAVYENDGCVFLGWYVESDGAYSYVHSADALKSSVESLCYSYDSIDVTLWAVWAKDDIRVELSKVSGTQWAFKGTYELGYAEGISGAIAQSAGVECSVFVTYYAHGKKLFGSEFSYDELGSATFNGLSGSLDKSGMNCGNGVGGKNLKGSVTVKATFSCNGATLGSTSQFEQFLAKS